MTKLAEQFEHRFGEPFDPDRFPEAAGVLAGMLARGSCRDFEPRTVDAELSRLLCAAALASPTKSDLQQRDIILVRDPNLKADLLELAGPASWFANVPNLAVFCGNNRRQRQVHDLRGHPFVNDHLDAFFNAAVDAGIALAAFVMAAEAIGLGCCPISAVRNEAAKVSELLNLPDHVFPVAGLAYGYPKQTAPTISVRLPLSVTVHEDRFQESDPETVIADYDRRREVQQPYAEQRSPERHGLTATYGWSEDKSRQYSSPERDSFGAFIRAKGFKLT
ncbi:nitroreductase family protein [Roseibium sp.]|uniref:nitroreductase family protein n=1 Tax=Roseibium sp. TaxID=1936156 RepID=UPI003BB14C9F